MLWHRLRDCRSACADSPNGQSAFRGETDGPRDIRGCRNPARTRCARGLLHPGAPRNARGSYGRTALRIVRLPFIGIALNSYDQHLTLLKMSKSARRKRDTPVCARVTGLTGCYSGREVRQERRLRLLRGNRLSAWEPISQTIAQLLVRSWDNGWDNRRGSTRDRIALKRRQRNDLVGFELFFRSQTLYPTELRARSKTLHCQQFTASSSSISTSSFGSFGALVRIHWMRYLSHAKQFK